MRTLGFIFNEKNINMVETVHFCLLSQVSLVAAYTDDRNLARNFVREFENRKVVSANFLSR